MKSPSGSLWEAPGAELWPFEPKNGPKTAQTRSGGRSPPASHPSTAPQPAQPAGQHCNTASQRTYTAQPAISIREILRI